MPERWELDFIDTDHDYSGDGWFPDDAQRPPDIPEGWEPFAMSTFMRSVSQSSVITTRIAIRRRKET